MRNLSDEKLLEIAHDEAFSSDAFAVMIALLGGNLWEGGSTNPVWLMNQAAVTAYARGLIDEQKLDWITR